MNHAATFARWALLDKIREAQDGIHGPVNRMTFECGPAYPETLARYNRAVQALLEFDLGEAQRALDDHLSKATA